jgi:hypothetical protein
MLGSTTRRYLPRVLRSSGRGIQNQARPSPSGSAIRPGTGSKVGIITGLAVRTPPSQYHNDIYIMGMGMGID